MGNSHQSRFSPGFHIPYGTLQASQETSAGTNFGCVTLIWVSPQMLWIFVFYEIRSVTGGLGVEYICLTLPASICSNPTEPTSQWTVGVCCKSLELICVYKSLQEIEEVHIGFDCTAERFRTHLVFCDYQV